MLLLIDDLKLYIKMNSLNPNITTGGDKNVTFPVKGLEDCQGYLSKDNETSEVGIVLIQEWWGLNKSIAITADKLSKEGFRVLVPDLYRGKMSKDVDEATHNFQSLNWDNALKDIEGAAEYLKSIGCKKIGITGFCLGGALTIAAVSTFPDTFGAGVPFYGVPDLTKFNLGNIKTPILAHFGEKDHSKGFSDPEAAHNLEKQAKEAGVNFTLHMWEGADHAFMNQDRDTYKEETASKALDETVKFFKDHLTI
jgi:carboxymethylenebutenolidase